MQIYFFIFVAEKINSAYARIYKIHFPQQYVKDHHFDAQFRIRTSKERAQVQHILFKYLQYLLS